MFFMPTMIRAYPIPGGPSFTLKMPSGAVVVRAEMAIVPRETLGVIQGPDGQPVGKKQADEIVVLFAKIDPSQPEQEYRFEIVGDEEPVEGLVYRASAIARSVGAWLHVFQSPLALAPEMDMTNTP